MSSRIGTADGFEGWVARGSKQRDLWYLGTNGNSGFSMAYAVAYWPQA